MFISRKTFEGLKITVHSIIEAVKFLLQHHVKYLCFDGKVLSRPTWKLLWSAKSTGVEITTGQRTWPAKFYVLPSRILYYHRSDRLFFSWTTGKDFVRDTLKELEIVRKTFKWVPHFLTNDNLITPLCSVYMQLHRLIAYLLIDI